MEHADTAQLAAVGGALGAVLVLLPRGRAARPLLLVGLALPGRRGARAGVGARRTGSSTG